MRFPEIFRPWQRPMLSFEVFPPRTDAAYAKLRRVLPQLVALAPDFMTVTYGAFGSEPGRTEEIAALIKKQYGMETACHLTCVGSSRQELEARLRLLRNAGLQNIVALRGDPPQGQASFTPRADGLAHADELVRLIRRFEASDGGAPFGIAVAGYPEKHLEAPGFRSDMQRLKEKVEAGADVVITQLFYSNQDYFHFVKRARAAGLGVPIVPGLMPVLSVKQVRRITGLCRATIPACLQAELEAAGDDDAKAEDAGVRFTIAQAAELLARNVPGIHFYVLNRAAHITRIVQALRY